MIGLDTGFFVELMRRNEVAKKVWETLTESEDEALVCSLSLFEIERLGLKGALTGVDVLMDAIPAVCGIVWIKDAALLSLGAKLSHGLGIPAFDSMILAAFVHGQASVIYTTDSHMENYRKKGMKIVNLRKTLEQ